MRLLQLISSPGVNGAIIHAVRFSKLLAEHGHEVLAAVLPGGWAAQQLAGTVEIVETNFDRTPAEFARFAELCRTRRIQATHSHLTRSHNFGWRLERRTGVPHLAHAQSHHWQLHWYFQRRVLAVAEATRRAQRRWYFRGANQVALLHNYADTARFRPAPRDRAKLAATLGVPADATLIACVAEVIPRKGQIDLVRALPEIVGRVPTARLVLFGREGAKPEYPKQIRTVAEELGVAGRVVWAGFRDDLPQLLPHCDVAVLPSLAEPFALGALEAMACGLPLVATRVGGFPEMITPGENGALAEPAHPKSLARAVIDVIADEPTRRRLADAAIARVARSFSPEGHRARYEAILREWGIG